MYKINKNKEKNKKKKKKHTCTFCGLALDVCDMQATLLFSLSKDGDTGSGLEKQREPMPSSRRAFGLDFTESSVFLILKAFLKSL